MITAYTIMLVVGTIAILLFIPWFTVAILKLYWTLAQKMVMAKVMHYDHDVETPDTEAFDQAMCDIASHLNSCHTSYNLMVMAATILREQVGIEGYIRLLDAEDKLAIGMAFVLAMGNTRLLMMVIKPVLFGQHIDGATMARRLAIAVTPAVLFLLSLQGSYGIMHPHHV